MNGIRCRGQVFGLGLVVLWVHAPFQVAKAQEMEDARKEWRKRIEQAHEQIQLATQQMRELAQQERLMSVCARIGLVAKPVRSQKGPDGFEVVGITPESAADRAGLKSGDVLLSIDGEPLAHASLANDSNATRILGKLRRVNRGETIAVDYRRGTETRQAQIAAQPRASTRAFMSDKVHGAVRLRELPGRWFDLELVSVNPDLGAYFGTDRGLLVVRASGEAEFKLKAGDVILKIGDQQLSTPTEAVRLIRTYEPGQTMEVEVLRQKQKQTLVVALPVRTEEKR